MSNNGKYINKIILVICISVLIFLLKIVANITLLNLPNDAEKIDFHFNLITINSIIAGFSFTNLGILISLSDADLVKKISSTSIIPRKNKVLIMSVISCCISIFLSLIFVLEIDETIIQPILKVFAKRNDIVFKDLSYFLYILCIAFLIFGIIMFAKSIKEMSNLLLKIYISKPNITKEDIKIFNKLLKDDSNIKHENSDDEFSNDS